MARVETQSTAALSQVESRALAVAGITTTLLLALVLAWMNRDHFHLFSTEELRTFMAHSGIWGPVLYIAILAVSVIVSNIPGLPLALAAGALWGPLTAGIYTTIGGFLGAMVAYTLGRSLGRSVLKALTGKVLVFSTHKGEGYVGWLIFVTRLLPVFSFDLISYGAGVTGLSIPVYANATLWGMIPSTFALTYTGSAIHLDVTAAILYVLAFLAILIGLPWVVRTRNWFDLNDIVRFE